MSSLLQIALARGAGLEETEALIAKSALREVDAFGRLPIHFACIGGCSSEVLELVMSHDPGALSVADGQGMVAMHYLAKHCKDASVVDQCLSIYPDAATRKDSDGWLPLHHAARDNSSVEVLELLVRKCAGSLTITTPNLSLPLHCAAHHNCSPEIVRYLLEQYPEGAATRGKQGMLPLHYAARSNPNADVLVALLAQHPKGLFARDLAGRLPAHYATRNPNALQLVERMVAVAPECLRIADDLGWPCAHYCARFTDNVALMEYLADQHQQGLSQEDVEGWLPLHHAALGVAGVDMLRLLVIRSPASAIAVARCAGKFAHQLAPAGSEKQTFLSYVYHAFCPLSSPEDLRRGEAVRGTADCVHLHLLGDARSGKSLLRHWLAVGLGVESSTVAWGEFIAAKYLSKGAYICHATEGAEAVCVLGEPSPQGQRQFVVVDSAANGLTISHLQLWWPREHGLFVYVVPLRAKCHALPFSELLARMLHWLHMLHAAVRVRGGVPIFVCANVFSGETVDLEVNGVRLTSPDEVLSALLKEVRLVFRVRYLAEDTLDEEAHDFVLAGAPLGRDFSSISQSRAVVDGLRAACALVPPARTALSPLRRTCRSILEQLALPAAVTVEDLRVHLHGAVQTFFKGHQLSGGDVHAFSLLFEHLQAGLHDSGRIFRLPTAASAAIGEEGEIVITAPAPLLRRVYGDLLVAANAVAGHRGSALIALPNWEPLLTACAPLALSARALLRLLTQLNICVFVTTGLQGVQGARLSILEQPPPAPGSGALVPALWFPLLEPNECPASVLRELLDHGASSSVFAVRRGYELLEPHRQLAPAWLVGAWACRVASYSVAEEVRIFRNGFVFAFAGESGRVQVVVGPATVVSADERDEGGFVVAVFVGGADPCMTLPSGAAREEGLRLLAFTQDALQVVAEGLNWRVTCSTAPGAANCAFDEVLEVAICSPEPDSNAVTAVYGRLVGTEASPEPITVIEDVEVAGLRVLEAPVSAASLGAALLASALEGPPEHIAATRAALFCGPCVGRVSRARIWRLAADALSRSADLRALLAAPPRGGPQPVLLAALAPLQRSAQGGLHVFCVSVLCAVCCAPCSRTHELVLVAPVHEEVLAALAQSLLVLESLLACRPAPRAALELGGQLQETLDLLLAQRWQPARLAKLQKTLFSAMRAYFSRPAAFAVAAALASTPLADAHDFVGPALEPGASARLWTALRGDPDLEARAAAVTRPDGTAALLCARPACADAFAQRGKGALAYRLKR